MDSDPQDDADLRAAWACTETQVSQWVVRFGARAPSGACTLELEVTRCMGDTERWLRVFGPSGAMTLQELDPYLDTIVSADGRLIGVEAFEQRALRDTATGGDRPATQWPPDGIMLVRLFPRAWR